MDFNNIDEIKAMGFEGFKTMEELFMDNSSIPKVRGVYFIFKSDNQLPDFIAIGSGGHFKGKNPNVTVDHLKLNWIDATIVLYIGKAGKDGSSATLKSRLGQYIAFGRGRNVGHWGGRLIWQLQNPGNLIVCWKALPDEDPRTFEGDLITQFKNNYGQRPFANLAD